MRLQFSCNIVLMIFIFIGSYVCKRHAKKYRLTGNELKTAYAGQVPSKYDFSGDAKKPIIINFKKALGPVEGLTRLLASVAEIEKDNAKLKEHYTNTEKIGSDLIHISQTEYPEIFHKTKGKNADNDGSISDNNSYFYPFRTIHLKAVEKDSPSSNAETAVDHLLSDPSIEEKHHDANSTIAKEENHLQKPEDSSLNALDFKDLYKDYIILPKDKSLKLISSLNNKDDLKNIYEQQLEFFNAGGSSGVFTLPNGGKNTNKKDKELPTTTINSETKKNTKKLLLVRGKKVLQDDYNFENSINITTMENVTNHYLQDISATNSTLFFLSNLRSSTTTETLVHDIINKKMASLHGTLGPNNSLNLQISLTLKINNDSFSLMPFNDQRKKK